MIYRYYSTQRPVAPGTFPKKESLLGIMNFERRTDMYNDIMAWGFIDYSEPLTKEEAEEYELEGHIQEA